MSHPWLWTPGPAPAVVAAMVAILSLALASPAATVALGPPAPMAGAIPDTSGAEPPPGWPGERLTIGARVQPRYELLRPRPGEVLSSFFLRRVRIDVRGQLLEGRVTFRVMPELAGSPSLRDAWIDYAASPMLRVRIGQFTVPYQWLRDVSGSRQHFAERGTASERFFGFPGGYDVGVGLHGRNEDDTFHYGAGIFDGAGRNVRRSNSAGHMASGRIGWAVRGRLPDEEPDLAHSRAPQLAVGAGVHAATLNEVRAWDLGRSPEGNARADWVGATGDASFRWRGLSLVPTAYLRRVVPEDPAVPAYTGWGRTVSAGYFVVLGRMELVGRLSRVVLDRDDRETGGRERGIGVNVYHPGHAWKTQMDYTRLHGPALPAEDVFLIQMHVQF